MLLRGAVTRVLIAAVLIAATSPGAFAATSSGSTLMDGDSVSTGPTAAIVHLANQRAVRIAPHSEARFVRSGNSVLISVTSGSASIPSADGMVWALGANESALIEPGGRLSPQGDGGSTPTGEQVELCELVNQEELELCSEKPKSKKCDWRLIEVRESEVEGYLAQGARYQGEDGLDCDKDIGPLILLGAAGLGAGKIAGIVAGGVLGAIIIDEVDDDGGDGPVTGLTPTQ